MLGSRTLPGRRPHSRRQPAPPDPSRRHAGDALRLVLGTALVAVTAAMARGDHVARLEAEVFRLVDDLPAVLSPRLQMVMQAGS